MSITDKLSAAMGQPDYQLGREMFRTGLTLAKVTNIKDEQKLNRVKCLPIGWGDQEETDWCYVMAPMGGNDCGAFFFPQVNDLVVLAFLDGDPHRPIVLGDRWTVLDPLASIVVGLMLVKVAVDLLKGSIGELTEQSLPAEVEQEIEDIVKTFPAVSEPHNLRTRRIGNHFAIEMHVRMDGCLSLSDAHDQATAIERELKRRFGTTTHVTIHMEPTKGAPPTA